MEGFHAKVTEELMEVRKPTSHPFGANFLIPEVQSKDISETLQYKDLPESVRAASKPDWSSSSIAILILS